jgi:hypothetical protein
MAKNLFDSEAFVRVELKHSVDEVEALFSGCWDHFVMAYFLHLSK